VGKATEHLLGEGIQPEHLNDDRLGRVLEQLFEAGLTPLFVKVALSAASKFGVNSNSLHLDSSSVSVHGAYLNPGELSKEEPVSLTITHGYSRDHRPDLKQFIVDLMCSGDGDVPLYLRVADGNESDQAIFAQLMKNCREQWERALRQALAQGRQTLNNPVGKPMATPTMRWVFQCFQSIHWVVLDGVKPVVN